MIGFGHLRLSPAEFWSMTLPEFFAACEGYAESKGAKLRDAPTKEEADALFANFDAEGNLLA